MVMIFPDTCLLMNFALIKRMDILEKAFEDNAYWFPNVVSETKKFSQFDDFEDLKKLSKLMKIFPEKVSDAEKLQTRQIQKFFLTAGESASKHMGESEIIALINSRFSNRKSEIWILTEDLHFERHAKKVHSIKNIQGTVYLMKFAISNKLLSISEANNLLLELRTYPRAVNKFPPLLK